MSTFAHEHAEIQELVERAGARGHAALVAGVLTGGEASFHAYHRDGTPVDETTLFELGSITKPFTGVLLAEMSERGEVSLDYPVSRYLADSELPRWNERPPTLEELATHRAALPNAPSGIGRKETLFALGLRRTDPWAGIDRAAYAAIRNTAARRPPGGRFGYSSLGFALLGDALSARAGTRYEQLLQDRISSPLGLSNTAVAVHPENQQRLLAGRSHGGRPRPPLRDQIPAAGAIRASARDLVRFLGSSLAPPEGLPGPALALAAEPRLEINGRFALGLGWMVLRRRGKPELIWHSGGTWGFRSFAAMIPQTRTAVVVLANTARSVDRLGLKLADGLAHDAQAAETLHPRKLEREVLISPSSAASPAMDMIGNEGRGVRRGGHAPASAREREPRSRDRNTWSGRFGSVSTRSLASPPISAAGRPWRQRRPITPRAASAS